MELAVSPGLLEVRDRGDGVEPGEQDAVFERFHRGSASRRGVAGSGLGLAIARELARGWGGDVTLRSRPGGGTIFEVVLPARAARLRRERQRRAKPRQRRGKIGPGARVGWRTVRPVKLKGILGIAGLAVLGLLVAVGISMAASSLSSQSIGISEEPLSAGEELAAPAAHGDHPDPRTNDDHPAPPSHAHRATPSPAPAAPPPAVPATRGHRARDDDGSGRGRGRGRGRGGDGISGSDSDNSGKGSDDD